MNLKLAVLVTLVATMVTPVRTQDGKASAVD
jgi:hypothetical protein